MNKYRYKYILCMLLCEHVNIYMYYSGFNNNIYYRMGKTVNASVGKLGAKLIYEYGEGDDDCSLEDDFEAWKEKLFPALYRQFHPKGKSESNSGTLTDSAPGVHSFEKVTLGYNCVSCQKSKPQIPDMHHVLSSTKHFFTAPEVLFIDIICEVS